MKPIMNKYSNFISLTNQPNVKSHKKMLPNKHKQQVQNKNQVPVSVSVNTEAPVNMNKPVATQVPNKKEVRKPKKYALLVGINYENTQYKLNGCINDVESIKNMLTNVYNYNSVITVTDSTLLKPTKQVILSELAKLLNNCESGDNLVFAYSGHGSSYPDTNGDETDKYDELIVPIDGLTNPRNCIKDDEIKNLLNTKLKSGVTLFVITDCCHSGTILDLKFNYINSDAGNTETVNIKEKETQGQVIMISGCSDKQTSDDAYFFDASKNVVYNGALTYYFLQTLKTNNYNISYKTLLNQIRGRLFRESHTQIPQMSSGKKLDINTKFSL
jgi:hypothetical protein